MRCSRWNFCPRSKPSVEQRPLFVKLLVVLSLFGLPVYLPAQEQAQDKERFEIDLSELQKEVDRVAAKPYSFGGFLEFQPALLGIDPDSTFSRLRFFRRSRPTTFDLYGFRLRLDGSYKKGIFSAFVRADTLVRNDFDGWDEDVRLFEGYLSAKPNPNFIIEAGKKVSKWGKGYAWNPVSFIDQPKNPEDPEEALEGSTLFTVDYTRALPGALKAFTWTNALIPVYRHVNAKFGELNNVDFASKLYLLAYDTDFDFMVATGSSRTTRYGFDFSRNLGSNFEVHGEFAVINNFELPVLQRAGPPLMRESEALSYLLGVRYLTEKETTYILEYYRNGTGYTRSEWTDFYDFVDESYRAGNVNAIRQARRLAEGPYGRPTAGRNYLYFRASQKEPFDILYLTPALTSIMNLNDASLVIIPEIAYSPATNLEFRMRTPVQAGRSRTDYSEKLNDYRIELRMRYFFNF
jgi:hypothetical protein